MCMTDVRAALLAPVRAADAYVERNGFRGYDPYDALGSPLFRVPVLRSSRLARFGVQQLVRRSPINLRPLLGIPKGRNPVTYGLMLQGYTYLAVADPGHAEYYRERVDLCLREILTLRSQGWSGDCWGYDFDWQTRYGRIPAFTHGRRHGVRHERALHRLRPRGCRGRLPAVRERVPLRAGRPEPNCGQDGSFSWSYSPLDSLAVPNATMKGARLCAQVYSVNGDVELAHAARDTVRFVCARQRSDGEWPYSVSDERQWVDNFHTGYVLDCLDEYERRTGDAEFADAKERGWRYYRMHFFEEDVVPKYFNNRLYPVDATACAQSLLTLCRFGDVATAERVAEWVIQRKQRRDGAFVYQLRARYVVRTPFMRWSVAWLFCALSAVLYALQERERRET